MMCHFEKLNVYIGEMRVRFKELNGLQSHFDLCEQDILHYIEFEKYDAATGAKLLKKLKETRLGRRQIKDEYEELQAILNRMGSAGLVNYQKPKKNYTYRTITLENILNN